jgi:hypothetical protein
MTTAYRDRALTRLSFAGGSSFRRDNSSSSCSHWRSAASGGPARMPTAG